MPASIPLLRAGVLEPIVLAARRMGIPTRNALHQAGLPEMIWGETSPDQALPLVAGMTFLEQIARQAERSLFGLEVMLQMPLARIRSMHLGYRHCATLRQVLDRFVEQARLQSSIADYALCEEGSTVWLVHRGRLPAVEHLQSDLLTVAAMIQAVRVVMGPTWLPDEVHLTDSPHPAVSDGGILAPCRVCFRQPRRAIGFPRSLLCREGMPDPPVDNGTPASTLSPLPSDSLSRELEALLPAYLASPGFNHARLERFTGIHFRTLQRHLQAEGETYTDILNRVRLRLAREMLEDEAVSLSEIARNLGYSNAPNFIRAFRGWTGVTPGEYRTGREKRLLSL